MLKVRVISALVMVLLLLAALFYFPRWGWGAFSALIALAACWEWHRLCGFSKKQALVFLVLSVLLTLGMLALYLFAAQPQWIQRVAQGLFVAASAFWLVGAPLWLKFAWRPHPALSGAVGWLVIFPAWAALLLIRDISPWLLLSILPIVWIADIAAYFSGRRFGKNKLAPSVSPGKTWEGVVGGLLGVMLYFFVWFLTIRHFGAPWAYELLLFGAWVPLIFLLLGAVSVLGDLFESWMKRGAGVKDSSNLLPGHGGVLDRIDAMTATLPLAALFLFVLPK